MKISNHQGNKLFLVCPFCQMDNFIQTHFGEVYFITAPAAIFNFEKGEFKAIKELIGRENIQRIYLVGETSCNFIKNVLENSNYSGLSCENEIQKIKSSGDTPHSLTLKILKKQANQLCSINYFGTEIALGKVSLHFLLTVKNENIITEI